MELGQDVDSELGERRDDSNEGIPRHSHAALAANAKHRVFVAWLEKRERATKDPLRIYIIIQKAE